MRIRGTDDCFRTVKPRMNTANGTSPGTLSAAEKKPYSYIYKGFVLSRTFPEDRKE
jgi:hypothetical protein